MLFFLFFVHMSLQHCFCQFLAKRTPAAKSKEEINKSKKEEIEKKLQFIQNELNKNGGGGGGTSLSATSSNVQQQASQGGNVKKPVKKGLYFFKFFFFLLTFSIEFLI